MFKNTRFLIPVILVFFVLPVQAFASTFDYGYFGTTSNTGTIIFANGTTHADTWIDVTADGGGKGNVIWWGFNGTENYQISKSPIPGTVSAPNGAIAFGLESTDGNEVYAVIAHSTNPSADTVNFTPGTSTSGGTSTGGGTSTSGGSTCTACEMFDCPGWSDYMGKVDDIISKIPPPPNWDDVAQTFRDTIAPQIKKDLQDVLGNAPTPSLPQIPGAPAQLESIDDRGITAPTGNEDTGLGNSTFDENDIKNGATVIQERQDPTGGFTINDPINGLPSQEDFEKNLPTPETGDSPNPPETDNPSPTDPTDGDNIAPSPTEGDNTAPSPTNGDNTAPVPSESGTAPIPNESGTAPIPDPSNETAPIPGQP